MPDLRAMQEAFWASISAAEGAASASEVHRWIVDFVRADARASAHERLEVYANMYFYRLRDNLAQDFPALTRVLGPARFHDLITDFLLVHPSRHPSVRHLGRALPRFMEGWQAELAALEWARLDVFDDVDDEVLTREDLAASAAQGFRGLTLRGVRAHRLVHTQHAVAEAWRADTREPARHAQTILVWRKSDLTVHHRVVEADECPLLAQLADGLGFEALAERLGETRTPAQAAERALSLMLAWTGDELLARQ